MAQHQYRWKGYLSAGIAQQEQDRYRLDNNFPRYSVTGNLHSGFSLQGQLHRQVGKWISVGIGIGRPEFQSLTLPNRLFVEDVHLNLQSIGLEVQFYPLRSRGKINPYLQVGVKYQWFVKN